MNSLLSGHLASAVPVIPAALMQFSFGASQLWCMLPLLVCDAVSAASHRGNSLSICPPSVRLLILQVLQGMPIIAAPPRAVETAPAPVPGPASSAEVAIAELIVPSQAVLLPLQPSKLTVYRLFAEQVCFCWQGCLHCCCCCCCCWLGFRGCVGSDSSFVQHQQKQ